MLKGAAPSPDGSLHERNSAGEGQSKCPSYGPLPTEAPIANNSWVGSAGFVPPWVSTHSSSTRLTDGTSLQSLPLPNAERVDVGLFFPIPSSVETTETSGYRHLVEHLMAAHLNRTVTEMGKAAGNDAEWGKVQANGATFLGGIYLTVSTPSKFLPKILDALSIASDPLTGLDFLDCEMRRVGHERAFVYGQLLAPEYFRRLFGLSDDLQSTTSLGSVYAVENATENRITDFVQTHFRDVGKTLVIVGDPVILNTLQTNIRFGGATVFSPVTDTKPVVSAVSEPKAATAALGFLPIAPFGPVPVDIAASYWNRVSAFFAVAIESWNLRTVTILKIAHDLLGEEFGRRLKEAGLSYGYTVGENSAQSHLCQFVVGVDTRPADVPAVRGIINSILAEAEAGTLPLTKFEGVKSYYRDHQLSTPHTGAGLLRGAIDALAEKRAPWSFRECLREVDSITEADVRRTLSAAFCPKNAAILEPPIGIGIHFRAAVFWLGCALKEPKFAAGNLIKAIPQIDAFCRNLWAAARSAISR